jgi:hypothetical protein
VDEPAEEIPTLETIGRAQRGRESPAPINVYRTFRGGRGASGHGRNSV